MSQVSSVLNTDAGRIKAFHIQRVQTFVVSSYPLVHKAFSSMLEKSGHICVLEPACGWTDVLLRIHSYNPGIIFFNDDGGDNASTDPILSLKNISSEFPFIKGVLLLNERDTDKEVSALKAGARAALSGNLTHAEIIDCIGDVLRGGVRFRKKVMERFIVDTLEDPRRQTTASADALNLTRRELEIAELASRGMKNKEIGDALYICEKTVKHHLSSVFRKLNIKKRRQLKNIAFCRARL